MLEELVEATPCPYPKPDTLIVSEPVDELLLTTTLVVPIPITAGTKRIVSTNDCPSASVLLVGRTLKTLFDEEMFWIRRVSVPVFETVSTVSLNSPTLTLPQSKVKDEYDVTGTLTALPTLNDHTVENCPSPPMFEPFTRQK